MLVFYEPDPNDPLSGPVTFTISGNDADDMARTETSWIEVPDEDLISLEGAEVQSGQLVFTDIQPFRRISVDIVNRRAGEVRAGFVTDILGQEMLYKTKEEEARAYVADPAPDIANYPLIQGEIGITAPDGYQLAQLWLNMSVQWKQIAAQIETARLGAIAQIETATSRAQIDAIVAAYMQVMG